MIVTNVYKTLQFVNKAILECAAKVHTQMMASVPESVRQDGKSTKVYIFINMKSNGTAQNCETENRIHHFFCVFSTMSSYIRYVYNIPDASCFQKE